MIPYETGKHNFNVTTTAKSLRALIDTAVGSPVNIPAEVDSVDLFMEDGDVRYGYGFTPTTTEGFPMTQRSLRALRNVDFDKLFLISISGTVKIGYDVGISDVKV